MTTTHADLRARWAAIPGVTFAATTAAPATPPRNKRNPDKARNANHRPTCYIEQPELYTSRGTRRLHPFGSPTEPGWITTEQALVILGIGPSSLSRLVHLYKLDTCTYVAPSAKCGGARKYYREEQIRALLHRPDRRGKNRHTFSPKN